MYRRNRITYSERSYDTMNVVYDIFKEDLLEKKIDFEKNAVSVALMRHGFLLTPLDVTWNDVRGNEIKGKGYVSGGQILQNVSITKKDGRIYITGNNLIWQSATFSVSYAMLYFAETKKLIGCIKLPEISIINANLALIWHKNGIITEDDPDSPPQYLKYYLRKETD